MPEPLIVPVGNVKGGVGKTTLAVKLAIHQALHGQGVFLVDDPALEQSWHTAY